MALDLYTDAFLRNEVLPRSPIGGGEGYEPTDRIRRSDAEAVVTSGGELADALSDHRAGVIWVPGQADIDLAGRTFFARGEVTLASDRGLDGSLGGRLYTKQAGARTHAWGAGGPNGHLHLYDDVSVRALRYIGPQIDAFDNPKFPGYIPFPSYDTYEERKNNVYSPNRARGMKIYSGGVEIGNIELAGWAQQGVYLGDRSTHAGSPWLHHIDGHDCMMESAGYVIDVARARPVITDSYFNAARHVICGFGYGDGGYTLRNCLFGPSHCGHILDMHAIKNNMSGSSDPNSREWTHRAGDSITVERCTFVETHRPPASEGINRFAGGMNAIAGIRGVPNGEVRFERCHIPHSTPEEAFNQKGLPSSVDAKGGYYRFVWPDNKYGMGSHRPGYGCELNLEDPMDGEPLIPADRREAYGNGIGQLRRTLGI